MKLLLLVLLYSSSVFSLSFEKFDEILPKKNYWFSGDSSQIAKPKEGTSEALKVAYKDLEPLITAIESSQSANLISQTLKKLNTEDKKELTKLIFACKFANPHTAGQFITKEEISVTTEKIEEDLNDFVANSLNLTAAPLIYNIRKLEPAANIFTSFNYLHNDFKICLDPKRSVEAATKYLVHELTHFLNAKPQRGVEVSHMDEEEFLDFRLKQEGGEQEAYLAQLKFELSVTDDEKKQKEVLEHWDNSINLNAEIIDQEKFNKNILIDRNYKTAFLESKESYLEFEIFVYKYMKASLSNLIASTQSNFNQQAYLNERMELIKEVLFNNEKTLKNNQANIAIIKRNLELRLSPSDRKNQEELYLAAIENSKKNAEIYKQNQQYQVETSQSLQALEVRIENTHQKIGDKNDLVKKLNTVVAHLNTVIPPEEATSKTNN